jgi:uncharacterized protein (UPF0210 family)
MSQPCLFRIRTITAFILLEPRDFAASAVLETKVSDCCSFLFNLRQKLSDSGYTVQTIRIATNPFGQFLTDDCGELRGDRIRLLDAILEKHRVDFCSLGSAQSVSEIRHCVSIIASSPRFSCSAIVSDLVSAQATAKVILELSQRDTPAFLDGGLGNFRFCGSNSCIGRDIPFFPAAVATRHGFAIGLENGALANDLLSQCDSFDHVEACLREGMSKELIPVQDICRKVSEGSNWSYLGIDTSLNPSLDMPGGSVAESLERLLHGNTLGSPGSLAIAATVARSLQSLPGIQRAGYCGIMLPVCEDRRLASMVRLRISCLLSISSVCGVGVDTLPIAADTSEDMLAGLVLDVALLAQKWSKPLSCRVFPGGKAGGMTAFESPYLCNSHIYSLSTDY